MKLSIIVTVYNTKNYIKRCLESLLNQTINDYEIIVVDDGSNDGSAVVLDDFQKKHPNIIKVIHKENGGVSSSRNCGLQHANGQYITYVDGDDYVECDCYKIIYDTAIRFESDIILFDYSRISGDNKKRYHCLSEKKKGLISAEEYILTTPSCCNKLIKKSLFVENQLLFPLNIWYEDFAAIPVLANYAKSIYYLPESFYLYEQSDNSITRKDDFKTQMLDIFDAVNFFNKNVDQKFLEEKEYLNYYYLLLQGSLTFYKYKKYEYINQIADIMKQNYPHWYKNKYMKIESKKNKALAFLFYHKQYWIIKSIQKLKKRGEEIHE